MTTARWSLARLLRQRLLLAVAALWTVAAMVAVIAVRHEMNIVLDGSLLSLAEQIPLDAAALASPPPIHDGDSDEPAEDVMHVLVRDAKGRVLRHVGPIQQVPWPLDTANGLQTLNGWRVATRRGEGSSGIVVQVGESLHERRQALTESTAAMVLSLLALLPLAALMTEVLLRRSFKSVNEASKQWHARHEADISPLEATDLPTEFEPMVAAVNSLVARLQAVVRSERAFAASSAHELRTPLAAARAQAQRLVAELPERDAQERALALVRSLDRLGNTATKLLQISRVESGIGLTREPVDLRQLATLILDEFRHHAGTAHRLQVHLPDQPVIVRGDPDALGIAMRNLIENALKHAPGAQVDVRIEPPARIVVCDDGPGVESHALDSLLQPFSRGGARTDGTGLGLAIVSKIAEQQHAVLHLESPLPGEGRGFRATLSLDPDGAMPPAHD